MRPDPSSRPFSWHARGVSFRHAFRGLRLLIATQHNARLHLAATLIVVGAGLVFQITRFEWMLLVFAIGLVWAIEAMNTAVEWLGDAVTLQENDSVGRAKDVAATAVLLASVTAAVIGALLFLPYLCTLFVISGGGE